MSSPDAMMEDDSGKPMVHDEPMMAEDEPRVIEVTAQNWVFTPATITAKQGEKILVRLRGISGVHSFGVSDMGINVTINPGETKDIEIPTDKAGTFSFRCMVPCGEGHMDMVGEIVIE